jgi:ketosteroid isomerase-like protein
MRATYREEINVSTQSRKPAVDPQELTQLLVARANAGDVDGMVELYEPGAVLCVGGDNVVRGAEQIRAFYAKFLATGVRFSVGEQRPARLSGDLALTSTRLPNGTITAEVARRQSDGSWRWAIDQPAIA